MSGLGDHVHAWASMLAASEFSQGKDQTLDSDAGVEQAIALLHETKQAHGHVYLIGNGGSAAIASHIANDLCNTGKLCATTLHESAIITCFANDYGYDQAFSRRLENSIHPGDLLIAISSSGSSANILNAVDTVHEKGGKVLSLSGFKADNPLRQRGDLNIWLDDGQYGGVEIGHLFVLHHIADRYAAEISAHGES